MISFPYGSAAPKVFRARYFCLWFAEGLVAPHQSPIRLKASVEDNQIAPGPLGPQKIVGAMPMPVESLQTLWFWNQPLGGYRHRRSTKEQKVGAAGSNRTRWINSNPSTGSLLHPNQLSE